MRLAKKKKKMIVLYVVCIFLTTTLCPVVIIHGMSYDNYLGHAINVRVIIVHINSIMFYDRKYTNILCAGWFLQYTNLINERLSIELHYLNNRLLSRACGKSRQNSLEKITTQ